MGLDPSSSQKFLANSYVCFRELCDRQIICVPMTDPKLYKFVLKRGRNSFTLRLTTGKLPVFNLGVLFLSVEK